MNFKNFFSITQAHPTADQFTPISSDEESGSSTSSGEEDMQTNTAGPSRSNSPASRKANPEPMGKSQ